MAAQETAERIVRQEVLCCISSLIWELTQNPQITTLGKAHLMELDGIETVEFWTGPIPEDDEESPAEVFEHWLVSDWFAQKLQQQGETVIELCNLNIWARTCSGQAITMDAVVMDIAEALKSSC